MLVIIKLFIHLFLWNWVCKVYFLGKKTVLMIMIKLIIIAKIIFYKQLCLALTTITNKIFIIGTKYVLGSWVFCLWLKLSQSLTSIHKVEFLINYRN